MLCVSVGVAHACVTLLDEVAQQAPQHVTARESGHGVSWESRAQFTARRDRPAAGMDEEWKECPFLWTWGTGQLWGTSTDLGQRKHLHWGYLSSP